MQKFNFSKPVAAIAIAIALVTGAGAQVATAAPAAHTPERVTVQSADRALTVLSSSVSPIRDDVSIQASHTFSREVTERIWAAARNASIATLTSLCIAYAPGWLKAFGCGTIAQIMNDLVPTTPPAGRCLQVFSKLGWPPIGFRWANCS